MLRTRLPRIRPAALGSAILLLAALAPASAQAQTDPRVTGQAAAQGADVIVNQVDSGRYPKVTVFTTVLRGGQPVKGLTASDFRVREDEVDQGPLTVEPRLNPLYAVVTLDTSGSMRQRLPEAKAAAQAFIDNLGANDRVRALSFARDVKALNGPGADRQSAKSGIEGTVARGDTALYDALYASVEFTKEQPGRKAVVLLSDGVDDDGTGKQLSKRSLSEALELAKSVNVPVYAIGLGTEIDDGILRRVAEETGGQYYKAPEASQLRELYARIGEQLSGQYSVSYESNLPADGAEHRIGVTVAGVTGTKVFRAPQTGAAAAQTSQVKAAVSQDNRLAGGDSFDAAVLIEPGKTYRLQDHISKNEPVYFAVEAREGQAIAATVRTTNKGVRLSGYEIGETPTPAAGIALVGPDRAIIGERKTLALAPFEKASVEARVGPGKGGRYYIVIGNPHWDQHRDTEFTVEVKGAGRASLSSVPATR